jgi:hypothetical protein
MSDEEDEVSDQQEIYSLKEFTQVVKIGAISSDDGSGYWSDSLGNHRNERVDPYAFFNGAAVPPKYATHVIWFSK